jgi:hypothetical protein
MDVFSRSSIDPVGKQVTRDIMKPNYTPNFSDPRILRKVKHVYGFCRAVLSTRNSKPVAKIVLDKHFGSQNHDLSRWMRRVLLVCTDNHFDMAEGKVKQYALSKVGSEAVKAGLKTGDWSAALKSDQTMTEESIFSPLNSLLIVAQVSGQVEDLYDRQVAVEWVKREYATDLSSLTFSYKDKASRLWHSLQNVTREVRTEVLAASGLTYSYDIEACAPTLIHQHAQQQQPFNMDLYLFALRDYLANRDLAREYVAQVGGIDKKLAKTLINALFCGARLGANRSYSLFHMLGQDYDRVNALRADPFVTELREDIKQCWAYIEQSMTRTEKVSLKTGKPRKLAINSRHKWARYFYLERLVMNEVRSYLLETGNRHFLLHDGWAAERPVDVVELSSRIHRKLGFEVRLEEEHYAN